MLHVPSDSVSFQKKKIYGVGARLNKIQQEQKQTLITKKKNRTRIFCCTTCKVQISLLTPIKNGKKQNKKKTFFLSISNIQRGGNLHAIEF